MPKGLKGALSPTEYLAAWDMFQRTGRALSEITRIMVIRTKQFAIGIFIVMSANLANCISDWLVVNTSEDQ